MLDGVQLTLLIGALLPEPVPQALVDALQSAQVTSQAGERSGFQLVFGVGKGAPGVGALLEQGYFDPPRRVVIVAMVNGSPNVLMDGVITRHDLAPSNEPGQSKLTVTGEDLSRMLDLIDFSWLIKYPAMPAEARVALILAKYAMYGIVPAIVPSIMIDVPLPTDTIPGHRGTDLQYLNLLAQRVGYVFYLQPGPLPGMNIAYWGPEIRVGVPQAALVVNSDAHSNVESMSFSFDGFAKTLNVILILLKETHIPIPIPVPDVNPISPPLGPRMPVPLRSEPMTGLAKFTPIQAALIAIARAARTADVVSGSGSLDVVRYGQLLQARQLVEVRGAGLPHDGWHYVKSVTHQIKPGEFKQSFTLARNAFMPWTGG
jgi:hypothetical protein